GDHQAEAQPLCLRGQRGQQRPAVQTWPAGIGPKDGHRMVKEPGMLNRRNGVRLLPGAQDVSVQCVLRCLDAKMYGIVSRHRLSPPFVAVIVAASCRRSASNYDGGDSMLPESAHPTIPSSRIEYDAAGCPIYDGRMSRRSAASRSWLDGAARASR